MQIIKSTRTLDRNTKVSREEIEEILSQAVEMVRKTVTPETAKRLFFTKKGTLYASFPSKKIRDWALKTQERYGLPHNRKNLISEPLLYITMRRIYKEVEFDLGRNPNIGWVFALDLDYRESLEAIIERKYNVERLRELDIDEDVVEEMIHEAARKIEKHAEKVAAEITKELTGGISYGALQWYEALGYPDSITILESDGKEIRKKKEIRFR